MRKLLGAILSSAVCVVLSFSSTGCAPKGKEKKGVEFADSADAKVEKEDGKTVSIGLKHLVTIIEVTIEPSDKGVIAEKDEKGAKVTVKKAADTVAKYTVKIKAKGEDEKEKVLTKDITFTEKKPISDPAKDVKKELALSDKSDTEIKKEDKAVATIKVKHGTISEAMIAPADKGLKAEKDGDTMVKVMVAKAADAVAEYTITIKGKGEDGKDKTLEAKLKVVGAVKKVDDKDKKIDDKDKKMDDKDKKIDDKDKKIDDKDKKIDDKDKKIDAPVELEVDVKSVPKDLTLTIDPKADTTSVVKFSKGKVDSATIDPKDKGVTVEGKEDWVKITVAKDAKEGDVTIKVKPLDPKAKVVEWKLKIKALPTTKSGFLDERNNDQRVPSTVRQVAVISSDRFVAMNRRM